MKYECKVCGEDIRFEEPEVYYPRDGNLHDEYRYREADTHICVSCLKKQDEKCAAYLLTSLLDSMDPNIRKQFVMFLGLQRERPDLVKKTIDDFYGIEGLEAWGLW